MARETRLDEIIRAVEASWGRDAHALYFHVDSRAAAGSQLSRGMITSGRSRGGVITSGAASGGVDDAPGTPGSAQCGMASLIELTGGFISPRILSAISRPEMHISRPEVPEPVPLQNLSQNLDKSRVNLENLEVLETAACRASPALGS